MYRVDGSSDLVEETLDHFDGYLGSRPVRIGNAASDQLQLDIYGEAMNSIHFLDSGAMGEWGVGHDGWRHIVALMDWLCEHWQDPDEGIWETRGGRQRFVYGQLMSWWPSTVPSAWRRVGVDPLTSSAGRASGTSSTSGS